MDEDNESVGAVLNDSATVPKDDDRIYLAMAKEMVRQAMEQGLAAAAVPTVVEEKPKKTVSFSDESVPVDVPVTKPNEVVSFDDVPLPTAKKATPAIAFDDMPLPNKNAGVYKFEDEQPPSTQPHQVKNESANQVLDSSPSLSSFDIDSIPTKSSQATTTPLSFDDVPIHTNTKKQEIPEFDDIPIHSSAKQQEKPLFDDLPIHTNTNPPHQAASKRNENPFDDVPLPVTSNKGISLPKEHLEEHDKSQSAPNNISIASTTPSADAKPALQALSFDDTPISTKQPAVSSNSFDDMPLPTSNKNNAPTSFDETPLPTAKPAVFSNEQVALEISLDISTAPVRPRPVLSSMRAPPKKASERAAERAAASNPSKAATLNNPTETAHNPPTTEDAPKANQLIESAPAVVDPAAAGAKASEEQIAKDATLEKAVEPIQTAKPSAMVFSFGAGDETDKPNDNDIESIISFDQPVAAPARARPVLSSMKNPPKKASERSAERGGAAAAATGSTDASILPADKVASLRAKANEAFSRRKVANTPPTTTTTTTQEEPSTSIDETKQNISTSFDDQPLPVQKAKPSFDDQPLPTTKAPVSFDDQPLPASKTPLSFDDQPLPKSKPSKDDQPPASFDDQPLPKSKPTSFDDQPLPKSKPQSSFDDQPLPTNKTPVSFDHESLPGPKAPLSFDDQPLPKSKAQPSFDDQPPVSKTPVSFDDMPLPKSKPSFDDQPLPTTKAPVSFDDAPLPVSKAPLSFDDQPLPKSKPSKDDQHPVSKTPLSFDDQPLPQSKPQPSFDDQSSKTPLLVDDQPTSKALPSVDDQPSQAHNATPSFDDQPLPTSKTPVLFDDQPLEVKKQNSSFDDQPLPTSKATPPQPSLPTSTNNQLAHTLVEDQAPRAESQVPPVPQIFNDGFSQLQSQPTESKTPTRNTNDVQLFDPLATQDWMIGWETPKLANTTSVAAQKAVNTPAGPKTLSLMDTVIEAPSPSSLLKYTERDLDRVKSLMREQANREQELLQAEIQDLDRRWRQEMERRKAMQHVLDEYETTIAAVIAQTKSAREEDARKAQQLAQDNARLLSEAKEGERVSRDLRERYDNVKSILESYKKNEEHLRSSVATFQEEVVNGQKRYETLKAHAEEKIAAANVEIARVRSNYEKEVASLQAKLAKADMTTKTLKSALEAKEKENTDLTLFCEDLIKRMDS